jgi:hypothetical protein
MARQLAVDFPTKTNGPSADYPAGSYRNVTTPSDGTGTPWDALIMNDLAGWQQELLSKAGIVESGVNEKVGASQYFEAMRKTSGYPGLIQVAALFNTTPSSIGLRLLKLDGAGVLVANYGELTNASWVGVTDNATADGFYRADDAAGTSRNTSGAYLILPDMAGQFVRGRDTTGAVDPDGATRAACEIQDWAQHLHIHSSIAPNPPAGPAGFTNYNISTGGTASILDENGGDTAYVSGYLNSDYSSVSSDNYDTDELRPTNVNFDFYVWY